MRQVTHSLQIRLRDIRSLRHTAEEFHHLVRHIGVEYVAPCRDSADRTREFLHAATLEEVTARPVFQRGVDIVVVVKGREDDDADVGIAFLDCLRRKHTVELGHTDVHEDDIDGRPGEEFQSLAPAPRHRRYRHVRVHFEHDLQALANEFLIVGNHDVNHAPLLPR